MTASPAALFGQAAIIAVVPTHDSARWLEGIIGSLLAQTQPPDTIVVVDNGSLDDTPTIVRRRWPQVTVVELGRNAGYGASVNVGAGVARGHVLACNADVVLDPSCVEQLSRELAGGADVGLAAPRLIDADGALQPSLYAFPTLRSLSAEALFLDRLPVIGAALAYQRRDDAHDIGCDVDWVPGALLLVRREAWDRIGGFDPRYFFFVEEVDLQARLHEAGWRRRFVPAATARHFGGKKPLSPELFLKSHVGMQRYFATRRGSPAGWAARAILLVTTASRLLAWTVLSMRPGGRNAQSAEWRAMFAGVLRLSTREMSAQLKRAAGARARRGTSRGEG